jgi:hypothetical protein
VRQRNVNMKASAANVNPPGPKSGIQHPQCYAKDDCNCSSNISDEHFISRNMLKEIELKNTVKVAGMSTQPPATFQKIPLPKFAYPVLCARHNNALSPLDERMGRLSKFIRSVDHAFSKTNKVFAKPVYLDISGLDVERWILKCILGLVSSGNLKGQTLKPECLELLYRRIKWPADWGLYFRQPPAGDPSYHSDSFLIETGKIPESGLILTVTVAIRGFAMCLCLGKPSNPATFGLWHPDALVLKKGTSETAVCFDWEAPPSGQAFICNHAGTYDGPPPNWLEWEKNG